MTTILIIDDNKDILDNLCDLLEMEGYTMLSASNGCEGLQLAQTSIPDLIICDVVMTCLDGFQVVEQLRRNPDTVNVPIAFLSAVADSESIAKGTALGATFITKPFYWKEILHKIKKLIE